MSRAHKCKRLIHTSMYILNLQRLFGFHRIGLSDWSNLQLRFHALLIAETTRNSSLALFTFPFFPFSPTYSSSPVFLYGVAGRRVSAYIFIVTFLLSTFWLKNVSKTRDCSAHRAIRQGSIKTRKEGVKRDFKYRANHREGREQAMSMTFEKGQGWKYKIVREVTIHFFF